MSESKDYTKIGEITIVLFKDGRCPAHIRGLTLPMVAKVLSSQVFRVSEMLEDQGGRKSSLPTTEMNSIFKYLTGEIGKFTSKITEAIMLRYLAGWINLIAIDLMKKEKDQGPSILIPDMINEKYS